MARPGGRWALLGGFWELGGASGELRGRFLELLGAHFESLGTTLGDLGVDFLGFWTNFATNFSRRASLRHNESRIHTMGSTQGVT